MDKVNEIQELEIAIPKFEGFYDTNLTCYDDDYDSDNEPDWGEIYNRRAAEYFKRWKRLNAELLTNLGVTSIEYKELDRPKFYNFSSDECVCNVEVDLKVFSDYVRNNLSDDSNFANYVTERFSSRHGFVSHYSNRADLWLTDYITDAKFNNVVFEGYLYYLMTDLDDESKSEIAAIF